MTSHAPTNVASFAHEPATHRHHGDSPDGRGDDGVRLQPYATALYHECAQGVGFGGPTHGRPTRPLACQAGAEEAGSRSAKPSGTGWPI